MASAEAAPRGKPEWGQLQSLKFDSTEAAQNPVRWNFAPWSDFRTYMDLSLCRALDDFRTAAHQADPQTPVGIEGTQMPHAFGGYDLWRLSRILDWVEPYDIGGAREIFGSFMPGRPILTTVFESSTRLAERRLWHLLLEGDHGCIVWWSEDSIDWKSEDYSLTAKAKALAPALREMTSPLARLFMNAEPEFDPITILYSQPSIQVDWLIESTVDGSTWIRRFSSFEAEHNRMAMIRNAWLKALQDLGYSPRFISAEEVARGGLAGFTNAALVLSQSWALSKSEAAEIESFTQRPGGHGAKTVLFCDGPAGAFDEHGRLRTAAELLSFERASERLGSGCIALSSTSAPAYNATDIATYNRERLGSSGSSTWQAWLRSQLASLPPPVKIAAGYAVRVHRYRVPLGQLLAFERNVNYQMSEDLKQAGGNEPLENPIQVEASIPQPMHAYDLRTSRYLGHVDRLQFTLDPWRPALFALTFTKLPAEEVLKLLSSK
jgi:hypothetical protein